MRRNCGWATVHDPESERVLGRGRVLATDAPPPCPSGELRSEWGGEIDLIRGCDEIEQRSGGTYLVSFEDGREQCLIEFDRVSSELVASGLRKRAHIRAADAELPALLRELGGEQ